MPIKRGVRGSHIWAGLVLTTSKKGNDVEAVINKYIVAQSPDLTVETEHDFRYCATTAYLLSPGFFYFGFCNGGVLSACLP